MGPDGKDTAQAAVYIDGQPVQYAGEITLPEQVERPAPPLLSSMGLTMEQAGKVAEAMAEGFRAICIAIEEAAAAVTKIWGCLLYTSGGGGEALGGGAVGHVDGVHIVDQLHHQMCIRDRTGGGPPVPELISFPPVFVQFSFLFLISVLL